MDDEIIVAEWITDVDSKIKASNRHEVEEEKAKIILYVILIP
jgi:hypothetical protein